MGSIKKTQQVRDRWHSTGCRPCYDLLQIRVCMTKVIKVLTGMIAKSSYCLVDGQLSVFNVICRHTPVSSSTL